jgi:hypothetical protein
VCVDDDNSGRNTDYQLPARGYAVTSLIGYNGGLLSVGGSLTTDPNCCCDGPPPPECPPCCIRIDWGSFNVDGDLYEQYTEDGITIDVRVIMPTKNSRIVCDGEEISVQWDVDDDPSNRGSWIRFGVAWEFGGETPSVGAGGEIYEFGLVDWLDVSASDYTVALTLNKCFLDTVTYNGFIQIGTDFPDWRIDIETARCPTTSRCCDIEPECANCCALIDLEDYATFEGKHYIVNNSTDAEGNIFTALLEISLPAPGIICKSESVILDLYLIPPRHGDIDNNTVITFPVPWTLDTFTPAINPVDGAELANEIDWGTLTATEYSATVNIDCEATCPPPLDFPMITVTNSQYGFAANVDFEECDVEGCCPVLVCDGITGLANTGAASSGTAVDDEDNECNVDANWTVNGGDAFIISRASTMPFGCLNDWIGVRCESNIEPGGPDGYEATFSLEFEIAPGTCLQKIVLYGEYSADNYVKEGEWKVNGVDQEHIPHGSFNETTTIGCVEFRIDYEQGGWVEGTNTIEITVKNGFVGSGDVGLLFGLNMIINCRSIDDEEPEELEEPEEMEP